MSPASIKSPFSAFDGLRSSRELIYEQSEKQFPEWLKCEPIQFPPFDQTFGWRCLVPECDSAPTSTRVKNRVCSEHAREFRDFQKSENLGFDDFLASASPLAQQKYGHALQRKKDCRVQNCPRETGRNGKDYCDAHIYSLGRSKLTEAQWLHNQKSYRPFPICDVDRCVHDGTSFAGASKEHRVCSLHRYQWIRFIKDHPLIGCEESTWTDWLKDDATVNSLSPVARRGELELAGIATPLAREIRYALHRYLNDPRRTLLLPNDIRRVIRVLQEYEVTSLFNSVVTERILPQLKYSDSLILNSLRYQSRDYVFTEDQSREDGWFDPIMLGVEPFPDTQHIRRSVYDLTDVTQPWLRDLLWYDLHDDALAPAGKRPSATAVLTKILAIQRFSASLSQIRNDHGCVFAKLGASDARLLKIIWDSYVVETPKMDRNESEIGDSPSGEKIAIKLSAKVRSRSMYTVQKLLDRSHKLGRQGPGFAFIHELPQYPEPKSNPRPRPISYHDFQLMIDDENIATLDDFDKDNVGLSDIWLTQAFQGGRISETLKLRLGCVGMIGDAQPYLWRDITKSGVVDWGIPCHYPVYERLLARRTKTLGMLRRRYASTLDRLDERGRAALEAKWDRTMPLFPRESQNPDLLLEVPQSSFRNPWNAWFNTLGLTGITTHQTRATLATNLLNNGAPPDLVRQVLGHFSLEALQFYGRYNDQTMIQHLQQTWAAGPGMDNPGEILTRPGEFKTETRDHAIKRIELAIVPVEHGLCRYGPVVGGSNCPRQKNCTTGKLGACEHFALTGADLAYWERKRDAAAHYAEGAPNEAAREYILAEWKPWAPVIDNLRVELESVGLLSAAMNLDLRAPVHDYFSPLFATGWLANDLATDNNLDDDTNDDRIP